MSGHHMLGRTMLGTTMLYAREIRTEDIQVQDKQCEYRGREATQEHGKNLIDHARNAAIRRGRARFSGNSYGSVTSRFE